DRPLLPCPRAGLDVATVGVEQEVATRDLVDPFLDAHERVVRLVRVDVLEPSGDSLGLLVAPDKGDHVHAPASSPAYLVIRVALRSYAPHSAPRRRQLSVAPINRTRRTPVKSRQRL